MYITHEALETAQGRARVRDMIRAAFDQGVGQLQFNVMSKDVLTDAQKNPDKYPTLIVRVTGYSAYFVELDKDLQDQIIQRTVHEV
jgi:formate C-acetyltransferase